MTRLPNDADAHAEPPALALRVLRAALGDDEQEAYVGDLVELFHDDRLPRLGATRARLWFWRDAGMALLALPWRRRAPAHSHGDATIVRILTDLHQAVRQLRRAPSFTALSALTLALGIGATTAVFSVAYSALLRPLPFPASERLIVARETVRGDPSTVSPTNFEDWRQQSRTADLAGMVASTGALSGDGPAEQVAMGAVTGTFFRVLGVTAALGRTFTAAEAAYGGPKTILLGHPLWARRYGADRSIVGRTIQVDGESREVIGVMPDGFDYPSHADAWVPFALSESDMASQRGAHYISVIGRLRPGATQAGAHAEIAAIAHRLAAAYPRTNTDYGAQVISLREATIGNARPALLVLLGAVGLLLLLACANVANLLLMRAARRERERVVRAALGAGRGALARAVFAEALILAVVGGMVGIALAWWGTSALDATLHVARPRLATAQVDAPVLGFALSASLLTALVFGLLPAISASRMREIASTLRGSTPVLGRARGVVGAGWGGRLRSSLVLAQIAITTLLLTGAALLGESFVKMRRVDLGFVPRGVWTYSFSLPDARYKPPQAERFVATLLERVRAIPGVRVAGATMGLPLSGMSYSISFRDIDGVLEDEERSRSTQIRIVTEDYFKAVGMRVVRGRAMTAADRAESPKVVVVNEALARKLWPGEDPLGHRFTLGTKMGLGGDRVGGTVIGVVADIRDEGVIDDIEPEAYAAHRQFPISSLSVAVRGDASPGMIKAVAAQVAALDPDVPVYQERALDDLVSDAVAEPRLYAILFAAFAGTALLLAAVGVYGVVALAVGQRTREFGVRVALGAARGNVVRLVLRQALTPVVVGLTIGLVGAWASTRLLSSLLFGVSATDPAAFGAVVVVLVGAAAMAVFVPARRATGVAPTVALRAE